MSIIKNIGNNLKKSKEISKDSIILRDFSIDDTDLDGEKVMMNLNKGEYFMMNEVGGKIWDIINKSISVKEIINIILEEFEVERDVCENEVIEFLESLRRAELISVS